MHTQRVIGCLCLCVCWAETHLSGCVHVGAVLDELSHHFHMALLRGQMERVQTILGKNKQDVRKKWLLVIFV